MSGKLLWSGLTAILALPIFFEILNISGGDTFVLVGAVAMTIGAVLLVLDK